MPTWLSDKEKYALIGLAVKIEDAIPFREMRPGLWAWTGQKLSIPSHWREWLGTIRVEEIEACNLVLLAKMHSASPQILDLENQQLQSKVSAFYIGLLLSAQFTPAHSPVALTGAQHSGEVDVRQAMLINGPHGTVFGGYPAITSSEVQTAAKLGDNYLQLRTAPRASRAWRLLRAISVYCEGRYTADPLDKLHQYCRCVDALILSEPGKGLSRFKSRTELFIGPHHHQLMGEIYAIRSDVEHLHEHKYLEVFDRPTRLDLIKKQAIAEHIARSALAHVMATSHLWPHFGSSGPLGEFWKLSAYERQSLWAAPKTNPNDALDAFDSNLFRTTISEALRGIWAMIRIAIAGAALRVI
jgi:hypothetical protein